MIYEHQPVYPLINRFVHFNERLVKISQRSENESWIECGQKLMVAETADILQHSAGSCCVSERCCCTRQSGLCLQKCWVQAEREFELGKSFCGPALME